jgi:hypothetical protein
MNAGLGAQDAEALAGETFEAALRVVEARAHQQDVRNLTARLRW